MIAAAVDAAARADVHGADGVGTTGVGGGVDDIYL
jgi:hypothetical protein